MRIIGVDSETMEGSPITFQLYGDDCPKDGLMVWTKSKTSTRDFLKSLDFILKDTRGTETVLFGHNLSFDFVSFFHDRHFILKEEEFSFEFNGWAINGIYSNVVFCELRNSNHTIRIIDTFAYFQQSLKKLAEVFCPELPKLKAPDGLGTKLFSHTDLEFRNYAMRDSEIAYHVGKYIIKMHQEYKIPLSVSAPHMAARIFRVKHLKKSIPLPSKNIVFAALHSYHGGKNNLAASPGWYENVYSLDIVSAYPAAMRNMPSFSNAKLYKRFSGEGSNIKSVPECGIYRISGVSKKCRWPIIYDHKFKPVIGEVLEIWTTGYELNEALKTKEISINSIYGFFYQEEDDKEPSPFYSYVDEFFVKKDKAESEAYRLFYKILMNSLYGKFIQTTDHEGLKGFRELLFDLENQNLSSERFVIAGGLFNPFIASLITGKVRAQIHRMEHKYKALHTATDGIFTQIKPKEISGLGGEKIDCYGDLLLLRNKCYIIYGTREQSKSYPKAFKSKQFKGKWILKYAHHGFYGTVFDMEKMYVEGKREYKYTKVNKLKESMRRNLVVNKFEKRKANFNY